MNTKRCEGCEVVENGSIYHEKLSNYRGRNICDWCRLRWEQCEEMEEREISFKEYQRGINSVFEA